MRKSIALMVILACSIMAAQEKLSEFSVSGIECRKIAGSVTPRMVEKSPNAYVDTCVQWQGIVNTVAEADVDGVKAWVKRVEGKWEYTGSTRLTISFIGSSAADMYSSFAASSSFEYLCNHIAPNVRRGTRVSFTGKILGVTEKPDPQHDGRTIRMVLIGITEIHALEQDSTVRSFQFPPEFDH